MPNGSTMPKWLAIALIAGLGFVVWKTLPSSAPPSSSAGTQASGMPAAQATPREVGIDASEAGPARTARATSTEAGFPAYLPPEAVDTLRLIERGGPYPHRQDDGVFGNREGRLPSRPRGYYREYTVETPGSRDRGARRIIAGGRPPAEFFYTDDHYRSFRRFTVDARETAR